MSTAPARPAMPSHSVPEQGVVTVPDHVRTEWPDELRLLLGPEMASITTELLQPLGTRPTFVRASSVNHQPGRSTTVTYRVDALSDAGVASDETLVVCVGGSAPDGSALLRCDSVELAAWRWPFDPALPGLARALDADRVGDLFGDLGLRPGRAALRVRAYRPGRRAVVEASNDSGCIFMKVVRPHRVEALHDTHRLVANALPIPDSLGWTDDGILVMPAIVGETLRDQLKTPSAALPAPGSVLDLLDGLPHELVEQGRPRDPYHSLAHHVSVLTATVPALSDQIDTLVERIGATDAGGDSQDIVPVHGDLYESQMIVARDGTIRGLLDVDTAGPGERVDDLANFCAHLSVLATTLPVADAAATRRYGARLLRRFEREVDRRLLRTRVAMGVIGLATGPFRVLEDEWIDATARRLRLATDWLDGGDG